MTLRQFANPKVICEGWYAVARAARLKPGTVRRITIGPRELVLYRDLAGKLYAVEPNCPHLGADLARGRVVAKGLQCAFHLWCWGADGTCTAGGGAPEKRRIRTYATEERWGLVWVWAGGATPGYELPAPRAPHIVRLPEQCIDCHPHMILGNGLDFTHVVPVHHFHFIDEPTVETDSHWLTVGIHTRLGPTFSRRLLGLAGRTARWKFTTIGPSLAWLAVQAPTSFELLWTCRPLADGRAATQTVMFLPRRVSLLRALPMMMATTFNDKQILAGLRFRPGFVPADAVFRQYAQIIEGIPAWS
jgi:phenylpropionate dioxygenase-like ring-hydroxylating dioxygenase large terminal subunit